ncbi:MAG TPA: tetratricopeptide repeat protein, partial [Puia sp.]|nr:tetratricopeptide repeat protein [Puia sp.]
MKRSILFVFISIITTSSFAQQTYFISDPEGTFKQAKEYYQKEYYSLAYPLFKDLQSDLKVKDRSDDALNYQEIRYYTLVCALKQNDSSAVGPAKDFIALENNKARSEMMSYHLAEYYFRKGDFATATKLYESSNIDNLSNNEIADMKFHEGYGYFTMNQFDKAKPLLDVIRQLPKDPNYVDANYYYGFICFSQHNYRDALAAFNVVEDKPKYQSVVPYYIANIYLVQNQKDKAISYAAGKVAKGGQYYEAELKQLVGHGY